jgi:hypothetical protein
MIRCKLCCRWIFSGGAPSPDRYQLARVKKEFQALSALPRHSPVARLPAPGRVRPAASRDHRPAARQARDGNGQHEAKFVCALTRPSRRSRRGLSSLPESPRHPSSALTKIARGRGSLGPREVSPAARICATIMNRRSANPRAYRKAFTFAVFFELAPLRRQMDRRQHS